MKGTVLLAALVLGFAGIAEAQQPARCVKPERAWFAILVSGMTELVPLQSGTRIEVCAYKLTTSEDVLVQLGYGIGSNCNTGTTWIRERMNLPKLSGMMVGYVSDGLHPGAPPTTPYVQFRLPINTALCLRTNYAGGLAGEVWYQRR
jgi:hypothetical protein